MNTLPHIIAIAGGEKAIELSIISALLGVCLASLNKRCALGSLDSNRTDLHQFLNVDCVDGRNVSFGRSDVHIQHTMFKNLDVIAFNSFDSASLDLHQQKEFLQEIKRLKADFVIFDLATATNEFSLNAFLAADERIILTTGDMFSVLDAYSLARSALLFKLSNTFRDFPQLVAAFHECGFLVDGKFVKPLDSMATTIKNISDDLYHTFKSILASFQPRILLSSLENDLKTSDFKYLGPLAKDLLSIDIIEAGKIGVQPFLNEKNTDALLHIFQQVENDLVKFVLQHILEGENIDFNTNTLHFDWIIKKNTNVMNK